MNHKQKLPSPETIPELVARLVIAFEKQQAEEKLALQSEHSVKFDANI